MPRWIALLCALALAACTTTNVKQAEGVKPASIPAGARIVVMAPDVDLGLLLATGIVEPKAEWSTNAQKNLATALETQLTTKGHTPKAADPATAMEGRIGQVLRLHEAVGQSIIAFNYAGLALPTKKSAFDWTLGEGAQEIAKSYEADYAVFVFARGSYASAGRAALSVLGALAQVSIPMGGQQAFVSLVDLKTGQIVWFNVSVAGTGTDMREAAGAASLVETMLKTVPL